MLITLLAIGAAFALPKLAGYILFYWWPQVKADSQIMLATEILFATVLALLLNFAVTTWGNRRFVESAKLASLVHARSGDGWLDSWRERKFSSEGTAARDAFVIAATGYHTFVDDGGVASAALRSAYDVRVMLANPACSADPVEDADGSGTAGRREFLEQMEASIACLANLRRRGRKVALKFYAEPPFWKLVILGEQVRVQYCHSGRESRRAPEYVFALNSRKPHQGLFVPFYMLFLNKWDEPQHPEYDFDRSELVYRDAVGNEIRREPFLL